MTGANCIFSGNVSVFDYDDVCLLWGLAEESLADGILEGNISQLNHAGTRSTPGNGCDGGGDPAGSGHGLINSQGVIGHFIPASME